MKKIIALVSVAVFALLCFTGCGRTQATKDVMELIKGIGDVTPESGEYLDGVAEAYEKLSQEEKDKVGNYDKYEEAKAEYDGIIAFNDDILAIIDASKTTFSKDGVSFSALAERGRAILEEYEGMKETRRSFVIKEIEDVPAALEILENYETNALACAAAYCDAYMELNAGKDCTVNDIGCICQVRDDKQYMFFAISVTVGGMEKNVYSQARFAEPAVYSAMTKNPDIFFADAPVSEESDALKNGNLTLSVEDVLAAVEARETTAPAVTVPEAAETTTAA